MGYQNFATGNTILEGELDNLMLQGTMRFTSEATRDSELAAVAAADLHGCFCVTLDTDSLWYHNGTAWVARYTPWTTYTPAWTNLTLNSGTVDNAFYQYDAGNLVVRGQITFAADTAVSGPIAQTIPDGVTAALGWAGGVGLARDDSGDVFENCTIGITPGQSAFSWVASRSGLVVSAAIPWTWAVSDQLTWHYTVPIQ